MKLCNLCDLIIIIKYAKVGLPPPKNDRASRIPWIRDRQHS
jgi:hypothetical protein